MTPQLRYALVGAIAGAAAKFYFKRSTLESLTFAFGAISAVALVTAKDD